MIRTKLSRILLSSLLTFAVYQTQAASLESIASAEHRTEARQARDIHRNPISTLNFFGIKPDMTVVEIWPGGGWYTDIIAPYLKDQGQFYAAHFDALTEKQAYINALERYQSRVEDQVDTFGQISITAFSPPNELDIAPDSSADMVLTFRNLHNWHHRGEKAFDAAFQSMYQALKPGGILGIVEHRLRPGDDLKPAQVSRGGYMLESYVIETAKKAGFVLVERSEINANPNDSTRHPKGVWTLPPSLKLGDQDRDKYTKIGESDRMTLKFIKPEFK